jgi:hypothetical protein
VNPKP